MSHAVAVWKLICALLQASCLCLCSRITRSALLRQQRTSSYDCLRCWNNFHSPDFRLRHQRLVAAVSHAFHCSNISDWAKTTMTQMTLIAKRHHNGLLETKRPLYRKSVVSKPSYHYEAIHKRLTQSSAIFNPLSACQPMSALAKPRPSVTLSFCHGSGSG